MVKFYKRKKLFDEDVDWVPQKGRQFKMKAGRPKEEPPKEEPPKEEPPEEEPPKEEEPKDEPMEETKIT